MFPAIPPAKNTRSLDGTGGDILDGRAENSASALVRGRQIRRLRSSGERPPIRCRSFFARLASEGVHFRDGRTGDIVPYFERKRGIEQLTTLPNGEVGSLVSGVGLDAVPAHPCYMRLLELLGGVAGSQ